MPIYFSGHELVEIAVQIERNGEAFYNTAAEAAGDQDQAFQKLFKHLAGEERKHITAFQGLFKTVGKIESVYDDEEGSLYLKALASANVFTDPGAGEKAAQEAKDGSEVLRMALGFEKDSILYFQEMFNLVSERDRRVVRALINQEKSHVRKLLALAEESGYRV